MITEHNWFTTNLLDKVGNPSLQFKATIQPYHFNGHLNFTQACDKAACAIRNAYPKIYLALSGGIDSCYVFETFRRNNVPFTPYIVRFKDGCTNDEEMVYALRLCKEHNIKPEIINVTFKELMLVYLDKVYKTINGDGIVSACNIILAEIAKKDGAVLVQGDGIVNDEPSYPIVYSWCIGEYDFYADLYDPKIMIPFYNYSIEIVNALLQSAIDYKLTNYSLKIKLYGMDRPKIRFITDPKMSSLHAFYSKRPYRVRKHFGFPNTREFYNYLAPWRGL